MCGHAEVQAAAGAEGYNNRYRNGWGASVAAVRAAVEEQRRNKRGTGTPVSQMAAPLPLSRFAWPVSAVRDRCVGRCRSSGGPEVYHGRRDAAPLGLHPRML